MTFPSERVEGRARFVDFFEEENERLLKALYFVTGNRHDAEELMQDAFLRLWERWDRIEAIEDPIGYLFRVALNGFRIQRRRAATAIRRVAPVAEARDVSSTRRCARTCASSSLGSRRGSVPPCCSWTCSAIRLSRRRTSCASARPR